MKNTIAFLIILLFASTVYSQNASTYFPANTGYKWYYKNTPLDSNNNPQQNLARYRVDTFAVVASYKGLTANVVRIKDNLSAVNQNTPYNDTNYYNFQTTNGWKYLSVAMLPDSIPLPGIMNFFRSMENWYSMFRFAQTVNSEYTIVSKDTTISYDTLSIPIRAKVKAKRLNDQTVTTVNGTYTAKKFVVTFGIYFPVLIFEYPIVERPDTSWFATDVWMIKEVTPSVMANLNTVGIPFSFNIPGNIYELTVPNVGISNISNEVPAAFELYQNYPNPFNPSTNIRFDVKNASTVSLKVYDIRGREVSAPVNEYLKTGSYSVSFDASKLSSGIYFYTLRAGDFSQTKQMLLVK
ncbi:MAG: T9SS type A sorting domain-containing protein [Bacteroidetes bacterium]|nr:T9SS type A sorting domain-containing protein [Bacteroidota bacterium]